MPSQMRPRAPSQANVRPNALNSRPITGQSGVPQTRPGVAMQNIARQQGPAMRQTGPSYVPRGQAIGGQPGRPMQQVTIFTR